MADTLREARVEFLQLPAIRVRLGWLEPWGVRLTIAEQPGESTGHDWSKAWATMAVPEPGRISLDGTPDGLGCLAAVFELTGDPIYARYAAACREILKGLGIPPEGRS